MRIEGRGAGMANVFSVPGFIVSGKDALYRSMEYISTFGEHALIVTDKMLEELGNVERLTSCLEDMNLSYQVYAGANHEPDDAIVTYGAEIYRNSRCDFLIGLGGGSSVDAAKAIGVVVSNGGNICDYAKKEIREKLPPVVAIPTTAGTGSEATKVAVIKDRKRGIKMMMSDEKLLVSLAVVDPVFTMTAPEKVTVNTGIDALCHAIESYTSRKAFSLSRMYSLDAIKKIYKALPAVYENGSDEAARCIMAEASMEAGVAFSNASVTIIHGMSRPLGAVFNIPHGLSNALLLKTCLPYIKNGAAYEFFEMAKELDIYNGNDVEAGAECFIYSIIAMLEKLDIPTLFSLGIEKNKYFRSISKMAEDALASGSPQNCKNIPGKTEIYNLYTQLWE